MKIEAPLGLTRLRSIAAALAALAAVTAAWALVAQAQHSEAQATPALALLELAALPVLLYGMVRGSAVVAALTTLGGVLALGTIAVAGARLELVLAVAILALAVAMPERTIRSPRSMTLTAVLILGGSAVVMYALVGGESVRTDLSGAEVLIGMAKVAAAAAFLFLGARGIMQASLLRERQVA